MRAPVGPPPTTQKFNAFLRSASGVPGSAASSKHSPMRRRRPTVSVISCMARQMHAR